VRARQGPKNTVIYTDDKSKEWIFSGGDRTWRNNNPGNLVPGSVSKRNGAIGIAGGFAVFPDYETGHNALLDCLRTTYANADIPRLIRDYAPKHENKTELYARFLRRRTGVKDDRKVRDFTPDQFERLWKAIEDMEGKKNNTGKIAPFSAKRRITAVQKNKKGTITSYYIDGIGWVSKEEGINLATRGEVDAVVAISSAGNPFLRTRQDRDASNNLENMG
jgi:hypothetical protein